MQKRSTDRIGVKTKGYHDLRHLQRVGDIGLAALAHLPLVQHRGVKIRRLDLFHVIVIRRSSKSIEKALRYCSSII